MVRLYGDFCNNQTHLMRVEMAEYRSRVSHMGHEIMRFKTELESRIPTVTPVPDTEGRRFREE